MPNDFNPRAFPRNPEHKETDLSSGMTLRDYFAAAALTGLLSGSDPDNDTTFADFADMAFTIADRMLWKRDL